MTLVETSVVLIVIFLFALVNRYCLQSWWRTMLVFLWAALLGFCFQFWLGPELNAYNDVLQLKIGFVSVALVLN